MKRYYTVEVSLGQNPEPALVEQVADALVVSPDDEVSKIVRGRYCCLDVRLESGEEVLDLLDRLRPMVSKDAVYVGWVEDWSCVLNEEWTSVAPTFTSDPAFTVSR